MTAVPDGEPETTRPVGRYEWEALLRRAVLHKDVKCVGFALATFADPDGTRIHPGEAELADSAGMGKSTARRHLALLRDLGMVEQVSRGGGHGPYAKATEYRLTVPLDLLERIELRAPSGSSRRLRSVPSPLTQASGDDAGTALTQESGDAHPEPVDNSGTPLALESADEPLDESNSAQITASHNSTPLDFASTPLPQSERPPSLTPTTKDDHTNPDPTQPDTAVDNSARRCPHGLSRATRPDGSPRCPACRRGLPAGNEPP